MRSRDPTLFPSQGTTYGSKARIPDVSALAVEGLHVIG